MPKSNPINRIQLGTLLDFAKENKWVFVALGVGASGGIISNPLAPAKVECPRADVELTHQQYTDLIVGLTKK